MINVAVLGFGTVGSGVVEIINGKDFSGKTGQDINVKKVLDIYNKEIFIRLYNNPITGIPKIIDLFEIDNQLIVIENYISGSSLQEIIDSGKLTKETIYEYMDELCSILEKLHNFSPPIIHRDIKPSNIIITEHNHLM